jgi:hypothetical protein
MSDHTDTMKQFAQFDTMRFSLFHPRGVRVDFITATPERPSDRLGVIAAHLDAGWLVLQPGLEEGENKDQFVHVVRGIVNDTTIVDLYREEDQFRFLGVYLDSDEDIAAFEFASGLKLNQLPEYVGVGHIERNKSKATDRFVVRASKPFGAVWKSNPKHNPDTEEGKKKAKRLFVRWADQRPPEKEESTEPAQPRIVTPDNAAVLAACTALAKAAENGPEAMATVWSRLPKELKIACEAEKDRLKETAIRNQQDRPY